MVSRSNPRSAVRRIALLTFLAAALAFATAAPGLADGNGGGPPPSDPIDTMVDDGGTSSSDPGTTEAVAEEQGGIDVSWYWTIDLLIRSTSVIL